MKPLLFASCATLLFLAAGCAGTTSTATTSGGTTGPVAPGFPQPQVFDDKGTMTAGVGAALSFTLGAAGVAPGVPGNVSLMYFELKWAGPTDLNLCVNPPSLGSTGGASNCDSVGGGGLPGMPDSPVHVTYVGPEKGTWGASPYANGASAQTDYDLAVTLFYGEKDVPAGYTAFK